MTGPHLILVGVVGAPHGVRGECRVKSYTGDPMALKDYRPLLSADGRRQFVMLGARRLKDDLLVARFDGISTREAAAGLTNMPLYVERAALPTADEDEFYHADLVGLAVNLPDGTVVGRVAAVLNHGAGDLLDIEREGAESLLVAFTKAFVPIVDLPGGRLVVTPEALPAADEEAAPADESS